MFLFSLFIRFWSKAFGLIIKGLRPTFFKIYWSLRFTNKSNPLNPFSRLSAPVVPFHPAAKRQFHFQLLRLRVRHFRQLAKGVDARFVQLALDDPADAADLGEVIGFFFGASMEV